MPRQDPYWQREGLRVVEVGTDDVIATCPDEEAADRVVEVNNLCWRLWRAVTAGFRAFEFLGERLNYADGAAGEAKFNLNKLDEWRELLTADIPEARQRALAEEVRSMLELDADNDPTCGAYGNGD